VSLDDDARAELAALADGGRLRVPRVVDGRSGPIVVVDGVEVVSFASNDYLGLASDPRLQRAASAAGEEAGTGVGASRLVVGNHRRHVVLEEAVADWMQTESARLFNTGYAANVGVLTTLLREGDVVFSDALNHASIIDGCRLSRAEIGVYPHLDLVALERGLADSVGRRRRVVVSETLFSMDGDLADVERLAALCRRYDAVLVLDEAHAVGARGPEGRGVAAVRSVQPDVLIGTFGKALGSFGAFAACSRGVAELLWNRARTLVFSTGLPPAVVAASHAAIEIVRGHEGEERRRIVAGHAVRLRERVKKAWGAKDSAIVPIVVGEDREAMQWSARLYEARMFVQGIRPPTVPVGTARLRVGLTASHSSAQVETLGKFLA
jgi:8-amino-7-oxononanoate synthase